MLKAYINIRASVLRMLRKNTKYRNAFEDGHEVIVVFRILSDEEKSLLKANDIEFSERVIDIPEKMSERKVATNSDLLRHYIDPTMEVFVSEVCTFIKTEVDLVEYLRKANIEDGR